MSGARIERIEPDPWLAAEFLERARSCLRKVCRLALKGSPTVLLLFFIEGEHQ